MSHTPKDRDPGRPHDHATPGSAAHDASGDALLARLRAADPARDSRVDLDALRATVAARAAAPDVPVTTDDLAAARARRWTTWPARTAAAAAAALLIGGGGGYAIGAAGDGPDPARPAILVDGPRAPQGGADQGTMEGPQGVGGPGRLGEADSMPYYGGRTVFVASGLGDDSGTAPAWAYDAQSSYSPDRLAAAATALALTGEVEDLGGYLSVGPQDGTGPSAQLMADGMTTLSYYDPTIDPWACAFDEGVAESSGEEGSGAGAGGEDVTLPERGEPCAERDLGPAPRGEDAVADLRELLGSLGLDPAAYEYEVVDYGDPKWTNVVAEHVVDGQRTGAQANATWTGGGLQSLYVPTAEVVELGAYPVVSPVEAVARLMDPRFGVGWSGPFMRGAAEGGMAEGGAGGVADLDESVSSSDDVTLPPVPRAGAPVAWPVDEVTLTGARLGTGIHYLPDGAVMLLPTYELTSDDGGVWTVLAVADEQIDFGGGR